MPVYDNFQNLRLLYKLQGRMHSLKLNPTVEDFNAQIKIISNNRFKKVEKKRNLLMNRVAATKQNQLEIMEPMFLSNFNCIYFEALLSRSNY